MLKVFLTSEYDTILARQKAQEITKLLGYDIHEQARIATAVSESVRILLGLACEGEVVFYVDRTSGQPMLGIRIKSNSMTNFNQMENSGKSNQFCMNYAELLMDKFQIEDMQGEGRAILLSKAFPKALQPMTEDKFNEVVKIINNKQPENPLDYMRQQNQEILNALVELKEKQEEINALNNELQETNKGVIALYNELEEKAEFLKQANEIKKSFLLNVSHEFKTPIHSILGMAGLLLDEVDGELSSEQAIQVEFIQNSGQELLEMVSDILDISKIEAGKITVYPAEIELGEIFTALRGMFKPINMKEDVNLVFELPENMPVLFTDKRKFSQILRNFISNALKFTERGEIRVFATLSENNKELTVHVSDTGIGIPEEEQELIFLDYIQVNNAIQKHVSGTGLGLPLSKKLAKLLNGSISLQSKLNAGSVFSITIPVIYNENNNCYFECGNTSCHDKSEIRRNKILVIDDDKSIHYLLQKTICCKDRSILEAINGSIGICYAIDEKPAIIILDLSMPELSGFEVLERLKSNSFTKDIPVIIMTSGIVEEYQYEKMKDKIIALFYKKDLSCKEGIKKLTGMINRYML
ncbi:MAG: response regulator [Ruminiclostridium sp.]|nr:response regulator [Ruminiclostridium sp.]